MRQLRFLILAIGITALTGSFMGACASKQATSPAEPTMEGAKEPEADEREKRSTTPAPDGTDGTDPCTGGN